MEVFMKNIIIMIFFIFIPINGLALNLCHTILHPNQLANLPSAVTQKLFYTDGEELVEAISEFLKNYNFLLSPGQYIQMAQIRDALEQKIKLSSLKITSCSFVFDTVGVQVSHHQKYTFWVTYCDDTGQFKKRIFEAYFESSGIKLEFGSHMKTVFFIDRAWPFLSELSRASD